MLESGIEIKAQPPGKNVRSLSLLSGGEQALAAIALLLAILKVRPAPFCIFDEIDSALDDVNVGRFAAYLQKLNQDTQFVVITHRRGTMETADILYGVTMQEYGVSKLLSINVNEMEKTLKIKAKGVCHGIFRKIIGKHEKTRDGVAGRIDSLLKGYTFFGGGAFRGARGNPDHVGHGRGRLGGDYRGAEKTGPGREDENPRQVRELLISIITELLGGDGETDSF